MTGTVYLVTNGSYSDYSVVHMAFTTRELADAFCERENAICRSGYYDDYGVEEYELRDSLPEAWVAHHAAAELRPDGSVSEIKFWDSGRETLEIEPTEASGEMAFGAVRLRVNNYRSKEAAERAIHDLAARVKAERAGVSS